MLSRAPNRKVRTMWNCHCACGALRIISAHDFKLGKRMQFSSKAYGHCVCLCENEVDVTEDGLIHGNCRSCGCLKKEFQKNICKALTRVDGMCIDVLEKRKSRSDNISGFRGVSKW